MDNLNYIFKVSKDKLLFFEKIMMEWKIMKKISKTILCFVLTLEKHLQSNQYQDPFFEIRHIRTKYVYFLFRWNFDIGFFIQPWRNRLCIWTISQERVDLDCNFWGSLPYKLTTVGDDLSNDKILNDSKKTASNLAEDEISLMQELKIGIVWQLIKVETCGNMVEKRKYMTKMLP